MDRKNKKPGIYRLYLYVALCSLSGVFMGATASQAEINQCTTATTLNSTCLTKTPQVKQLEGMGMGLFAGAGAAIGSTWRLWQKED
ncbi:MAG TPA: hypothetical protein V6D10_14740 [Trichocoleus sp.]|jgi:hypothetical protein